MGKFRLGLFWLFLVFVGTPAPQTFGATRDLWTQANDAYQAGRFEEAKVDYLQLVSEKRYSANLFYNLGNAWFKLGDKGRAILNYKRVLTLQPGDAEASANLQMVLRAAESEDHRSFTDDLGNFADYFPLAASVSFWLAAGCAVLWALAIARSRVRVGFWLGLCVCLISLALTFWIGEGSRDPRRAIVIENAADMKFGPANSARTVETLSTGQEIRLLTERGEWSLCRTAAGLLGWVSTRKFERLIPR
jgi:tetratricopeptide (TPR) repeat protein